MSLSAGFNAPVETNIQNFINTSYFLAACSPDILG